MHRSGPGAFLTLLAAIAVLPPAAARADGFARIESREEFVQLISGRALTRLGINLTVAPDGGIEGRAFGRKVTGAWRWDDGFFCRDLAFGNDPLEPNCQVVERRGATLRFTADRGSGDHADLSLR